MAESDIKKGDGRERCEKRRRWPRKIHWIYEVDKKGMEKKMAVGNAERCLMGS